MVPLPDQRPLVPSRAKGKTPKPKPAQPEPKAPRYMPVDAKVRALAERLAATRAAGVGQSKIAQEASVLPFVPWRAEGRKGEPRVTADEYTKLVAALDRIDTWERAPRAAARVAGPTKADLIHRIEVAAELVKSSRSDKSMTKAKMADALLAVLDPQPTA